MKRLLALVTALWMLLGSAALAEDWQQNAILYSETGYITLYQKPGGAPLGESPSNLHVWYDFRDGKKQWVNIFFGGLDESGMQLSAYVKRTELLDTDGMDLSGFYRKYPEAVPYATLNTTVNVFNNANRAGQPIGRLAQSITVWVLMQGETASFVQLADFSGFVDTGALTLTGTSGALKLDLTSAREATVYCAPGSIVPIYSTCSETGLPPEYALTLHNGDTVQVLKEVEGYAQIAYSVFDTVRYGGFIPQRFLLPEADHSVETRYILPSAPDKRVNLRGAARSDGTSLGIFCGGTPVQILSDDGQWAYVIIGDITGFMMDKYLTATQSDAGPQTLLAAEDLTLERHISMSSSRQERTLQVTAGTEMSLLGFSHQSGDSQNSAYVRCGDYCGYAELGALRPADESHAIRAKVNSKALNLRDAPDKEAYSEQLITNGKQVTVLLHGDEWSYIRYGTAEGFVMSKYLKFK